MYKRQYKGYVSQAGIVQLFSDSTMTVLSGDIDWMTYDESSKLNTISFSNATNFELEFGDPISVSNHSFESDDKLVIFPNPTKDKIYFQSTNSKIESLQLFSLNGTFLLESKQNDYLNLNPLTRGIYYVKIKLEEGETLIRKVVRSD